MTVVTAPPSQRPPQPDAVEPVIDSHVHVWDPARVNYPWLVDAPALNRRLDLSDVAPELDAAGVVAVVLVQGADHVEDTELMLEIAASNDLVAGVVGWVPLLDPVVAERTLDRWKDDPIVGVRHLIHRDPDPDLLADRRIDDVLAMLAERNLTFDVCAESVHLLRLVPGLAERHASLTLVIDHLAKPPIAAGGWDPWAGLLAEAAAAPNTVVKLSGLNTAAAGASPADYRRYVDHALDIFGPERTMYGGDWPFALLAADSYSEIWRDLRATLDSLNPADRHQVLAGTTHRVYKLSVPTLTATR
ncbi:MAG TPA: amidohydrolase family protein [Ilumatobacter sp.]